MYKYEDERTHGTAVVAQRRAWNEEVGFVTVNRMGVERTPCFFRLIVFFFFQAEDGIRDLVRSRGLGDV